MDIEENIFTRPYNCLVGWVRGDCRIHQLQLSRGVPHSRTSVRVMTQNNLIVRFNNAGALKNTEYPFIAITPRSTLSRSGSI